jgi:hypothetical protein
MKADAVGRIVREVLGPWCKQMGLRRMGSLTWSARLPAGDHLTIWFQLSRDGWDDYAGSKLVVELQISPSAVVGAVAGPGATRDRLTRFFTHEQLARVTQMQNDVIRKLTKPPAGHFIYACDEGIVDWYDAKFETVGSDYRMHDDVWFRYHDAHDVRRWAIFVLDRLPDVVRELAPDA